MNYCCFYHFYRAAVVILLICYGSFDLSCPILEKDTFCFILLKYASDEYTEIKYVCIGGLK